MASFAANAYAVVLNCDAIFFISSPSFTLFTYPSNLALMAAFPSAVIG
ncbi:MAG: hypothetical protein LBJ95_03020 [Oscillospiraceae bacterium]|jgi:hypothetical protein|nr:hypothetical protein [Oscillospiraceae bacterium]